MNARAWWNVMRIFDGFDHVLWMTQLTWCFQELISLWLHISGTLMKFIFNFLDFRLEFFVFVRTWSGLNYQPSEHWEIIADYPRAIIGSLTLLVRLICPKKNVNKATMMKLRPPAKSVSLSKLKIAAIRKNISWMVSIVIAEMAKWSVSRILTAIFSLSECFPRVRLCVYCAIPNISSSAPLRLFTDFHT